MTIIAIILALLFLDGWCIPQEALTRNRHTIIAMASGLVLFTMLGLDLAENTETGSAQAYRWTMQIETRMRPTTLNVARFYDVARKQHFPHEITHALANDLDLYETKLMALL